MRFFTADNHWRHANILKYCPTREYKTIEEHDRINTENWNETVGKDDDIYVLGDWAFSDIATIKQINKNLSGKKHLIIGNHDRHSWSDYIRSGFSTVQRYQFINIPEVGPVGLAHDPSACITDRTIPWLVGHMHQQFVRMFNCINVGIDVRKMRPVSETSLLADFNLINISIRHDAKQAIIARKEICSEE